MATSIPATFGEDNLLDLSGDLSIGDVTLSDLELAGTDREVARRGEQPKWGDASSVVALGASVEDFLQAASPLQSSLEERILGKVAWRKQQRSGLADVTNGLLLGLHEEADVDGFLPGSLAELGEINLEDVFGSPPPTLGDGIENFSEGEEEEEEVFMGPRTGVEELMSNIAGPLLRDCNGVRGEHFSTMQCPGCAAPFVWNHAKHHPCPYFPRVSPSQAPPTHPKDRVSKPSLRPHPKDRVSKPSLCPHPKDRVILTRAFCYASSLAVDIPRKTSRDVQCGGGRG